MPRVLDGRLSPGQLTALRLAANGHTSKQIASRVGVTEAAIHLRLTLAARSLGAASRTQAVAVALRLGLIDLDDIRVPERWSGAGDTREGPSVPASRPNSARGSLETSGLQSGAQSPESSIRQSS
ncbi:LuxR C-terminal-related transcriptional regulator [Streptomyces flavidovirens]|uniref:LuxR C-terminal-related transcriptional regulator n=1 Tax=Streptomyces flavidovirens TaxID=67298 RepID=UPI0036AAD955